MGRTLMSANVSKMNCFPMRRSLHGVASTALLSSPGLPAHLSEPWGMQVLHCRWHGGLTILQIRIYQCRNSQEASMQSSGKETRAPMPANGPLDSSMPVYEHSIQCNQKYNANTICAGDDQHEARDPWSSVVGGGPRRSGRDSGSPSSSGCRGTLRSSSASHGTFWSGAPFVCI